MNTQRIRIQFVSAHAHVHPCSFRRLHVQVEGTPIDGRANASSTACLLFNSSLFRICLAMLVHPAHRVEKTLYVKDTFIRHFFKGAVALLDNARDSRLLDDLVP